MKLRKIITHRFVENQAYWDLIFEWEDAIKDTLHLKLYDVNPRRFKYLYEKFYVWHSKLRFLFYPFSASLYFETFAKDKDIEVTGLNKPNIVPWIVDCYTRSEQEIKNFVFNHRKNKVILISSKEVFDYLKGKCNLPLRHLPLSLPDKFSITPQTKYDKDYDVILMGRQNPLLFSFLKKYAESHKDFSYLYRKQEDGKFNYYNKKDEFVGDANTREHYMNLIKRTRVGIYSTPGTDREKKDTNGFSQVTPRFLEYVAAGTHIIARYLENADTEYYELGKFSKSINTYEEFEERMDWCLSHEVNMQEYSEYLSKHYTSVRIKELKEILRTL